MATNITIDESVTNVNISGVSETTPSYTTITLSNDQGPQGPTGSTPTFTANATGLAAGASPTASVTGTTNNPVLNLGIPKGDKGDTGNAATVAVNPITVTGAAGSSATVINTGDQYNANFQFTIPKGDKGDTGTSITNVQRTSGTGAPGTTDTYTITFSNATTTTFPVYNGSNGRAISSIAKTSTVGLVDTYTVTYSDATTSTFTVTNGAKGDTGDFDGYGFGWTFSNSTNMGTAPNNGTFKINNANSASATQIAISKVNSEGGAVNTSWFSDLATTNNNRIIIRKKTLPGTYIVYATQVNGLYDNGTYVVIDIAHITRNGSITNGDSCWIVAMVGGQDGATGGTGPGLAAAGNTGDLLIKTGIADYQTGWTTPSNTPANGVIPLYASSSYGSGGLKTGQGGIGIIGQGAGLLQTIIGAGGYGSVQLPTGSNVVLAATTDRTAGITGNQTINTVYAAPSSGSAGLANFRSLVANDIPTLAQSKLDGVSVSTWAPNTSYTKGDLASYNGITYRRVSTSSSDATFNTANWQQITPLNTFAGHAQLNSSRTLANNTTCNPVFVDNSGTVVYLNLEPDKTYFFEGWIQNTTATTTTSKNPLISFYYIDELGNGLTPQSFSMVVNTFTSGVTYNAAGTSSVNTDLVINGTTATAGTYYSSYRGFIRTASTTTNSHRINIGIGQSSATGAATGVIAASRSYINVTDMGTGLNAITGYWT